MGSTLAVQVNGSFQLMRNSLKYILIAIIWVAGFVVIFNINDPVALPLAKLWVCLGIITFCHEPLFGNEHV